MSGYVKIVPGSGVGLGTFRNRVDGWLKSEQDGEMVGSADRNDNSFSVGLTDGVADGYAVGSMVCATAAMSVRFFCWMIRGVLTRANRMDERMTLTMVLG